jgi:diadenosine tetraphosphatase ApaH/serine/threonine PP2A family protein phosphatase
VGEDEYLFFGDDAKAAFFMTSARIILFGHTHWQVGFSTRGEDLVRLRPEYGSQNEAGHHQLRLRRGTRYALNPGSVGQPRDGDWRAAFALYDTARALFTWHRVPYEIEATQRRVRRADLSDFLAKG